MKSRFSKGDVVYVNRSYSVMEGKVSYSWGEYCCVIVDDDVHTDFWNDDIYLNTKDCAVAVSESIENKIAGLKKAKEILEAGGFYRDNKLIYE